MPICNIGTAQSMFDQLDATFEAKGIPWKNVMAFIGNTYNTMVGKTNSVVTKIKEKNSAVFEEWRQESCGGSPSGCGLPFSAQVIKF